MVSKRRYKDENVLLADITLPMRVHVTAHPPVGTPRRVYANVGDDTLVRRNGELKGEACEVGGEGTDEALRPAEELPLEQGSVRRDSHVHLLGRDPAFDHRPAGTQCLPVHQGIVEQGKAKVDRRRSSKVSRCLGIVGRHVHETSTQVVSHPSSLCLVGGK